jgi:hypothetical protein
MIVFTPSLEDCSPAQNPLAVPPMTKTTVTWIWSIFWLLTCWNKLGVKKSMRKIERIGMNWMLK